MGGLLGQVGGLLRLGQVGGLLGQVGGLLRLGQVGGLLGWARWVGCWARWVACWAGPGGWAAGLSQVGR